MKAIKFFYVLVLVFCFEDSLCQKTLARTQIDSIRSSFFDQLYDSYFPLLINSKKLRFDSLDFASLSEKEKKFDTFDGSFILKLSDLDLANIHNQILKQNEDSFFKRDSIIYRNPSSPYAREMVFCFSQPLVFNNGKSIIIKTFQSDRTGKELVEKLFELTENFTWVQKSYSIRFSYDRLLVR